MKFSKKYKVFKKSEKYVKFSVKLRNSAKTTPPGSPSKQHQGTQVSPITQASLPHILKICNISHMSDPDDFAGKIIEGTGEHNPVLLAHRLKDRITGRAFRNIEYGDCVGETTL